MSHFTHPTTPYGTVTEVGKAEIFILSMRGLIMRYSDIQGWFSWGSCYREAVQHFPDDAVLIEVGCYLGRSLCFLGQEAKSQGKQFRIVGVELGTGSGVENGVNHQQKAVARGKGSLAGELHRNIMSCGLADSVSLLLAPSLQAAKLFQDESVDFVFIDARHDYESVKMDITAWLPKIKPGGWIAGDDYTTTWEGVVRAVKELLPDHTVWTKGIWINKIGH